jgi:hypothetical protein
MRGTPEIHLEVERVAKCKAIYHTSQTVIEKYDGTEVARQVEVYTLNGHPEAKQAFAWKRGAATPKVIMGIPPINSAEAAVRRSLDDNFKRLMNMD